MKNSDRRIRTIGLVLEDAFTDFASDIIHSVSLVVKNLKDIRLVVIPGRQDDSNAFLTTASTVTETRSSARARLT